MELAKKLKDREDILKRMEYIEGVASELNKALTNLEHEIMAEATNNMVSELVVDDKKYKFQFKNQIFIKESVSDHSKKVELLKRLTEMGYNEAVFFESAYYPKVALRKVFDELTPDTINQFSSDGLIYHETKPSITQRIIKGK